MYALTTIILIIVITTGSKSVFKAEHVVHLGPQSRLSSYSFIIITTKIIAHVHLKSKNLERWMWSASWDQNSTNLSNYRNTVKLSFVDIFMIITMIIIIVIMMMIIITREEHVHELAVGGPRAELLNLGELSLQMQRLQIFC